MDKRRSVTETPWSLSSRVYCIVVAPSRRPYLPIHIAIVGWL